jgi:chromosomal replication initiator protein
MGPELRRQHEARRERLARFEAAAMRAKPAPAIEMAEASLYRLSSHAEAAEAASRAEKMLAEMMPARIRHIKKTVAEFYQVPMIHIDAQRRAANVVRARHAAMYLAKILTTATLPRIGRHFGGRDHTTVLHAVSKMERLIATDPHTADQIDLLMEQLAEPAPVKEIA